MPVISGGVRDDSGNAIPEAAVFFVSGPVSLPDIAALTDARGEFSLSAPTAGDYVVGIRADGFDGVDRPVTISGTSPARMEVTLAKR
jgi:Carboxypeptidase regulatory-like domain